MVSVQDVVESGWSAPAVEAELREMREKGFRSWVERVLDEMRKMTTREGQAAAFVFDFLEEDKYGRSPYEELEQMVTVLASVFTTTPTSDERVPDPCFFLWILTEHMAEAEFLEALVACRVFCWHPYVWSIEHRSIKAKQHCGSMEKFSHRSSQKAMFRNMLRGTPLVPLGMEETPAAALPADSDVLVESEEERESEEE